MENDSSKPRRFIFGRGTMMALVVVLALGIMKYTQKPPAPLKRFVPPASAETIKTFAMPNEPSFAGVIARSDVLGLDEKQTATLQTLEKEWKKEAAPMRAEMKKMNDEMGAFLDSAKKPTLEDIKKKAAPLSDVSAKYTRLRMDYEKKISAVLTQEQAAKMAELDGGKR